MPVIWYKKSFSGILIISALLYLAIPHSIKAQNNGIPLLFQGLTEQNSQAAKGAAYGNAFVSRNGELNSLFYNPAGLADIKKIQISASAQYTSSLERNNHEWYPYGGSSGPVYVGIPLYMEHLLIPDPAWNGIWSDSLDQIWYDTNGNPIGKYWDLNKLKFPVQGKDEYSEEAADNQHKLNTTAFDQISFAYPFQFMDKNFVFAAAYNRQYDVNDYDWNGSKLDPHWGTSTIISAQKGDTTRTNWSLYNRTRTGGIYSITGALAFEYDDNFQFGIKLNILSGTTDDQRSINRIGYFLTKHQMSNWAFSYDTNNNLLTGSSKFTSTILNIGGLYKSDNFNLGINLQLPYTLDRVWQYTQTVDNGKSVVSSNSSGTDKVDMPAVLTAGLTIKPGKGLTLSFDYENNALSKADFNLDKNMPDSLTLNTYTKWVNQYAMRFGIEYEVTKDISILGGYQYKTAPFIPYGNAIRDEGPQTQTYSFGFSINILDGRLDAAYTYYLLKYYDAYMNNRNFTLERIQKISLGYTFTL